MPIGPDLRWNPHAVLAEDVALELGIEAYISGYPLVLADTTRRVMTSYAGSGVRARAPINQFGHLRAFPDHAFTDLVSPNADALSSTAWLSLAREPKILSVPPIAGRYAAVTLLDAWTNVRASLGTRTMAAGGHLAIVGPRWHGPLPSGIAVIEVPTNLAWIAGQIETRGTHDYAAVHAIQDQFALTPLRSWGQPSAVPLPAPNQLGLDTITPPTQQVLRMEARTFFSRLNHLMRDNAPAAADAPALERLAAIGIAPGEPFDLYGFEPQTIESLERSAKAGQAVLVAESRQPPRDRVNGWDVLPSQTGAYGTDYTYRAVVALVAFGAGVPADCWYARATVDGANHSLTGQHRYMIRFPTGHLPPAAAWSISLYDMRHALVPNAIDRHALGSHDPLAVASDGSTTICIQRERPDDDREPNWLPAPDGMFTLGARLFGPPPSILNGGWRLPAVERVD